MMPGVVYNKDRVMGKECDCGKELLHLPRNQAGWSGYRILYQVKRTGCRIQRMGKEEYLITEAPLKALTVFALPMIIGSFFQQVYNMADSIIVGQFVGSSALAAVGACAALSNVFICVAIGAGVGAGVLVSRYFGAQKYDRMKTIVSTSLISFLVLGILLGIFGFVCSHWMMRVLQTPADILDVAVLYLRVYFVGFPFLFMYNILSTMFAAIGESRIPLGLLIFSSVLNIGMDLWMVKDLGLGVFGAALATLLSQGISAVLSLIIFFCRMRRYAGAFRRFDGQELRAMLQIAVPSVLQQSTVSVGMIDDRAGSGKPVWDSGACGLCGDHAGRERFFSDLRIHRQCRVPLCIPEPWSKKGETDSGRIPCRIAPGFLFCCPCLLCD